jgi:HSP20 family protein
MAKKLTKKSASFPQMLNFSELDRVFDNFRRDMEESFLTFPRIDFPSFPKFQETSCDIVDEGKQFRVKMNIPGVTKKEISLNVTDNALEVHAEHKEKSEEKKKNYLRKERSQLHYDRTVPLSAKINPRKVKSKLIDGVLEITLPKSKPTHIQKKRTIKVQ